MGRVLGRKCLGVVSRDEVDVLVPVPTHWSRRFTPRGDASELLAEGMSRELQRPVRRLLRCRRRTRKQGTLLPNERRQNVRRAFSVPNRRSIKGARIIVVDDVMTTGSTGNEMARVLREAGADTITLAVAARGVGFD